VGIKANRINEIEMAVASPEKAGVGGSIPSLATSISTLYRPSNPSFGSNWFQFQPADNVSCELRQRRMAPIDSPVLIPCVPFDVFIYGFGSVRERPGATTAILLQALLKSNRLAAGQNKMLMFKILSSGGFLVHFRTTRALPACWSS
jgi:hypothetical protein